MPSLGEKVLKEKGIPFSSVEYDFRKKGADAASEALGIPISATLKSLVVKTADNDFIFLLIPGDRSVSMKSLARILGVKSAEMASQRDTERLTGYQVGGISPFGSRTPLPVYVDLGVADHEKVYINGGRRGLLLCVEPDDLIRAVEAELIDVSR
jgi:Cys-tRNA(Pro) deacylase